MSEQGPQKFQTDDIHYPDLGRAFDRLKQISLATWPIKSTTQIWVMTLHQSGISAVVVQTSFCKETSDGIAKCRLFPKVTLLVTYSDIRVWQTEHAQQ